MSTAVAAVQEEGSSSNISATVIGKLLRLQDRVKTRRVAIVNACKKYVPSALSSDNNTSSEDAVLAQLQPTVLKKNPQHACGNWKHYAPQIINNPTFIDWDFDAVGQHTTRYVPSTPVEQLVGSLDNTILVHSIANVSKQEEEIREIGWPLRLMRRNNESDKAWLVADFGQSLQIVTGKQFKTMRGAARTVANDIGSSTGSLPMFVALYSPTQKRVCRYSLDWEFCKSRKSLANEAHIRSMGTRTTKLTLMEAIMLQTPMEK